MSGIVDCHTHLFPPAWKPHGRMPDDMFEAAGLVERMDASGIAVSLVSDPHIWYGDLDPGDLVRTREYNEFAAGPAADHRGRLVALATVSPWRGAEHLAEAERAVTELGLAGLAMPTSDRGLYLDAVPEAFWELAASLGVPVFLHPGGTVVGQELMEMYRLGEVCGRPLDTTLTLARHILTGGMERHPGVGLLCAHAGGAICTIADRLDFGHELREYAPLGPWGEVHLPEPPSAYVARLHLDTVTFGTAALRPALDRVGPERILYGSDRPPVPFEAERSLAHVRAIGLQPADELAVLGGNARRLFRLP